MAIVRHHPTLRSLLRVYDNPGLSERDKELHLADKMGGDVRFFPFLR